jgi:hypothetical protein
MYAITAPFEDSSVSTSIGTKQRDKTRKELVKRLAKLVLFSWSNNSLKAQVIRIQTDCLWKDTTQSQLFSKDYTWVSPNRLSRSKAHHSF